MLLEYQVRQEDMSPMFLHDEVMTPFSENKYRFSSHEAAKLTV